MKRPALKILAEIKLISTLASSLFLIIPVSNLKAADIIQADCESVAENRDRNRSISACTEWLSRADSKNDKEKRAHIFHKRAYHLSEIGSIEQSLKDYGECIRLNPNNAGCFNNRGNEYRKQKKFAKAITEFNKAIKLNPSRSMFHNNLGLAYGESRKYYKSIEIFSKAIELNPTYAEAFNNRGASYENMNEQERALEDYTKAIELNPNYARAHRNRGEIYAKLRSGRDYRRAITDFNASIRLDPKTPITYVGRGDAHAALGNQQKALADYEAALERDPNLRVALAGRDKMKAALATEPQSQISETPKDKDETVATSGRHVALTIGVNSYQSIDSLRNALNDADAVANALAQIGYEVIRGQNLDRSGFNRTLLEFEQRIGQGDTAVFFFAGHGVAVDSQNYLLPSDVPKIEAGEESLLKSEAFMASDIAERMKNRGAKVAILVLDACRDNPFKRKGTRSTAGATRGLERMHPPRGTFVLFSAGAGDVAHDQLGSDDPSSNSVFTRVFADEVTKPGARLVDIALATQRRVNDLAREAQKEQIPAYYDEFAGFLTLD